MGRMSSIRPAGRNNIEPKALLTNPEYSIWRVDAPGGRLIPRPDLATAGQIRAHQSTPLHNLLWSTTQEYRISALSRLGTAKTPYRGV